VESNLKRDEGFFGVVWEEGGDADQGKVKGHILDTELVVIRLATCGKGRTLPVASRSGSQKKVGPVPSGGKGCNQQISKVLVGWGRRRPSHPGSKNHSTTK